MKKLSVGDKVVFTSTGYLSIMGKIGTVVENIFSSEDDITISLGEDKRFISAKPYKCISRRLWLAKPLTVIRHILTVLEMIRAEYVAIAVGYALTSVGLYLFRPALAIIYTGAMLTAYGIYIKTKRQDNNERKK